MSISSRRAAAAKLFTAAGPFTRAGETRLSAEVQFTLKPTGRTITSFQVLATRTKKPPFARREGTAARLARSKVVSFVADPVSSDDELKDETLAATVAWLDASFGIARAEPPFVDRRGPLILLLLAGAVLAARPLSRLLPRVSPEPAGAGLPWRRLWVVLLVPAIATPLVLRLVPEGYLPTSVLPVLVADYLAAHFLVYGLITAACLALARRRGWSAASPCARRGRLALAVAGTVAYGFVAIVWPLDTYVTSFWPGADRLPLVAVMLAGTLPFFLADEWATRGAGAARLGYPAAKLAFVLSLALAVGLDFERLFFLVIIVPVIERRRKAWYSPRITRIGSKPARPLLSASS